MSNTPSDAEIWQMWMPMARKGVADPVEFARAVLAKWGAPQSVEREPQCWCLTCRPMRIDEPSSIRMALCPTCGNKRCPKANDHRNRCSNSNVPGQKGSAYEGCGITQKVGS